MRISKIQGRKGAGFLLVAADRWTQPLVCGELPFQGIALPLRNPMRKGGEKIVISPQRICPLF